MCGHSPVKGEGCTIPTVSEKILFTDLVKEIIKDCLFYPDPGLGMGIDKKKIEENHKFDLSVSELGLRRSMILVMGK